MNVLCTLVKIQNRNKFIKTFYCRFGPNQKRILILLRIVYNKSLDIQPTQKLPNDFID